MSFDKDHTEAPNLEGLGPAIRARLDESVDPRLLLLHGLREAGWDEALTQDERDACHVAKDEIARGLVAHPALTDVVAAVKRDADLFALLWPASGSESSSSSEATSSSVRSQRSAGPDRKASRTNRSAQRRTSVWRWPARIGLGVSALVLAVVMVSSLSDGLRRTTVSADSGAPIEVALGDGSTARLGPGASLTFVPGPSFDRSVSLSGNAFFDVRPDTRRFSVSTPDAVVSVLGTQFGVETQDGLTEVVLVQGKVAVSGLANRQSVVILEPGQRTSVESGGAPAAPSPVDVSVAMPWTDLLTFRNTPMSQVVLALQRIRGTAVELGPGLSQLTVSGTFRPDQSVEQILAILSATLEADVNRSAAGFSLSLR